MHTNHFWKFIEGLTFDGHPSLESKKQEKKRQIRTTCLETIDVAETVQILYLRIIYLSFKCKACKFNHLCFGRGEQVGFWGLWLRQSKTAMRHVL